MDWRGDYFNNRDLKGTPALVRDDPKLDFAWGRGSPANDIQPDNFSGRWTISREVPAGNYRFSVWVDYGVRVWVNNQLIINGWVEGVPRNYIASVNVGQSKHEVRAAGPQPGTNPG